jgi:putative chitinase
MAATATPAQLQTIIAALNKRGITNPVLQAAILSIVQKETGFYLRPENMNYTSTARLRTVWPSLFPTDAAAAPYVRQPERLANFVYGGKYGNVLPGDGWLYRGRGYNGITFRSNYEQFKKMTGHDIVNNPELLNNENIAADVLAAYYQHALKYNGGKLAQMGVTDYNAVTDLPTAVRIAMRANAGWGTSVNGNIFREGEARAKAVAPTYLETIATLNPVTINIIATKKLIELFKNKKTRPYAIAGTLVVVAGVAGLTIYFAKSDQK